MSKYVEMTTMKGLKGLLLERSLTINQFAKMFGVSASVIYRGTQGKRISVELANKILTFFHKNTGLRKTITVTVPERLDAESTALPYNNYMKNFIDGEDPDIITHKISSRMRVHLPVEKTDEEIERMHQYNQMMGRR